MRPSRAPLGLPSELLVEGVNVLAVELHQNSPTSNDAVFGLEVIRRMVVTPSTDFVPSNEEWIELYNRGDTEVDVSSWQLTEGITATMPPGTVLRTRRVRCGYMEPRPDGGEVP